MEKISRRDAASSGQITYFTGEPCKHGHVAYRYTKNGACSECVKGANFQPHDPNAAARREARGQMVQVKIRAFAEDREGVASGAYALALMRWPVLLQSDVDPKLLPTHREPSGTALYAFLCHEEDIGALRSIGAEFLRQHQSDVAVRRAQLLGQVLQAADVDTSPPMSFK